MKNEKLAMPLLGVLLWVISIHAGTFAAATLLPRPVTGQGRSILFHPVQPIHLDNIKIDDKDLNKSVAFGSGIVNRMLRLETNLGWSNINVKKGTPSHGQFIVSNPEKEALIQGRDALVATKATVQLMNIFCNTHNLSPSDCSKFISSFSLISTPLEESCKKLHHKICEKEEIFTSYRSIDGTCNHRSDGSVGAAFTGYKRLLHPEYFDGIQEPRRAINKALLPSARQISAGLVQKKDSFDSKLTLAVMQWSQFIEHDLSHTPISKMIHTENSIECCASSGRNLSPRYIHPFCSPISIPYDDDYYAQHGLVCMTYVRSVPAIRSDCTFGPMDQINQATHFLDGSQIYGSTLQKMRQLRQFNNGKLTNIIINKHAFLPLSLHPTEDCQFNSDNEFCFISGDSRVNTHPQLAVIHTLWMREHNRIVDELAKFNSEWSDEVLFQEARRIIIAEMQQITYNEWLPQILGKKYITKIQKYNDYSENVNPSISNSFATAVLRVLNSLMDDNLKLFKENRSVNTSINLRQFFNRPKIIQEKGYFDAIVRGLGTQQSQNMDFNFVEDITNYLFSNGVYGFDVFSLDIQRGRDHGLPSYPSYRTICGLSEVHSFNDLRDVMSEERIKALLNVYADPRDIDLIVGGLAERPDGDSLFGPTFSCIMADQFLRSQRGDRYFFTNEDQPTPFSHSQIQSLKKVTLARIFCDNADDVKLMQPNVFQRIGPNNELVECNSERIPKLNLKLWIDERDMYY